MALNMEKTNKELMKTRFLEYRKRVEWFILHGQEAMNRIARRELFGGDRDKR